MGSCQYASLYTTLVINEEKFHLVPTTHPVIVLFAHKQPASYDADQPFPTWVPPEIPRGLLEL